MQRVGTFLEYSPVSYEAARTLLLRVCINGIALTLSLLLGSLSFFLSSADFFPNHLFKNSFRNTIKLSNSLDPDQARHLAGLIWVQTVCKRYQQTALAGKELRQFNVQWENVFWCITWINGVLLDSKAHWILNMRPKVCSRRHFSKLVSNEAWYLHVNHLQGNNGVLLDSKPHWTLRERSGSVVDCLTWDRRAAGSSLIGVTVLWSLSKTYLS